MHLHSRISPISNPISCKTQRGESLTVKDVQGFSRMPFLVSCLAPNCPTTQGNLPSANVEGLCVVLSGYLAYLVSEI